MRVKDNLTEHVLHAQRTKHVVLLCMISGAICAGLGYEFLAIASGWAANIIWIYET